MHVIIEYQNGVITNVTVAAVAGQLRRRVPVRADPALQAAYLKSTQGKQVKQSEYEKHTQIFEERLLLLINNMVVGFPPDTIVIAANKLPGGATLLLDLVQTWQSGKYCVADGKITPTTDWQEPTLLITPTDDPLAP